MTAARPEILERLHGGFVTSCQPVRGGVFDVPASVALFARAAEDGGTDGLRIESVADLRAVRSVTRLPIVGLVKRDVDGTDVFITPSLDDVRALAAEGADVIAFDGTDRTRPVPVDVMIRAVPAEGRQAMADVATFEEGVAAWTAGADLVGTTLSGYAPGRPLTDGPDLDLVDELVDAGVRVVAEGRIATPREAADAIRRGAWAVTVGTAITRPEWITRSFVQAVHDAGPEASPT